MYETAPFLMEEFPQSILEPATNEGYVSLPVAAMTGYGFLEGDDDEDVHTEVEFFRDLVGRAPMAIRVTSHGLLFPFCNPPSRRATCRWHRCAVPCREFSAALRQLDGNGRRQTAMHLAVSRSRLRLDYVRLLAELRPELLEATDRSGSTPLHTAADQVESFVDVLGGLERRDPVSGAGRVARAARCWTLCGSLRNSFPSLWHWCGWVPLHVAASRIVPDLDVVRLWVGGRSATRSSGGARPRGVTSPAWRRGTQRDDTGARKQFLAAEIRHSEGEDDDDDDDDEPDEIAVRVRRADARTLELVQTLVEGSSESVRHKNGEWMIPLLVAAENDAPPDVLFFLAIAWPEAIYVSRRCGGTLAVKHSRSVNFGSQQSIVQVIQCSFYLAYFIVRLCAFGCNCRTGPASNVPVTCERRGRGSPTVTRTLTALTRGARSGSGS
jgi:hypothetical protein